MDFVSVTSPAKAYLITDFLEGAVERGASRSLKKLGVDFPCAVSCGVSPNSRDSWCVGYSTDLLTLVWVGYDDHRIMEPEEARNAGGIWALFMNRVRPWMNARPFRIPPGIVQRIVCRESGMPANRVCPEKRLENFLADFVPKDYCTIHKSE